MLSIASGRNAVASALLSGGADPNLSGMEQFTPLMTAALYGKAAVADVLLARGAELHLRNAAGSTALDIAIRNERPQVVERLRAAAARD